MTVSSPSPGQRWRAGTKVHRTVYIHDGDDPAGVLVGVMDTPELAAHVIRAVNAWDWGSGPSEGRKVLDTPMQRPNDAGAATIRDYLVGLAEAVWDQGSDFSGKRPYGNSGWRSDLYIALGRAGLVDAEFDDDGYLEACDDDEGDRLIRAAIAELGRPGQWTPKETDQ